MKFDLEMLKKHLFWILLGVGLFMVFLAWICLNTDVAGAIASGKKVIDQALGKAKQPDVKSPEWKRLHTKRAQLHKKLETRVWKNARQAQEPLFTWPSRFEEEYHFKDGLFAKSIVATRNVKGKESGGNSQAKAAGKQNSGAGQNQVDEEKVIGKVKGTIDRINAEVVEVKTTVNGKETILPIYRTNDVKVTLTEGGKQDPQAIFDSLTEHDEVEVTFQRGKYFGDELTRKQWQKYKDTYREQIDGILKIVQPWTPEGGVVQFRGWVYEEGKPPPAGATFFHYVPDWKETTNWSPEAWTGQEDLWIQRELYRLVRQANDHAAQLQCEGGMGFSPFYFESADWKLTLQLTKEKKLKAALTNRSDYFLPLGKVKLAVRINRKALTANNTVFLSFDRDGEVEPQKTVTPTGSPFALPPGMKAEGVFAASMEIAEERQAKETGANPTAPGGVPPSPPGSVPGGVNAKKQKNEEKKTQTVKFACTGGRRDASSVFYFANSKWKLKLYVSQDKKLAVEVENLTPFPRRLDADFKVLLNEDDDLDDDERYFTFRAQHAMVPPKNELTARDGKNKVFPKGTPFALPSGLTVTGIYGVQQMLSWQTAAVKRIDYVSIGSGKSPGGSQAGSGPGGGPATSFPGAGQPEFGTTAVGGGATAHSHKTAPKGLVAFFKQEKAANKQAAGNPQVSASGPAGDAPGGGPADGAMQPGSTPGGGDAGGKLSANGFDFKRYVEVTREARRVPVAVALIVDQEYVGQVLAAFTNSKMRFLTTQVLINRYPQSIRPQVAPGKNEKTDGGEAVPGASIPPGGAPAASSPGVLPGAGGQPTAPVEAAGSDRITNVELVIYGIVTIYRRFPPRDTTAGGE